MDDPGIFICPKEQVDALPQFSKQIYTHRFGIYSLFKKAYPDQNKEDPLVQQELFNEFLDRITYEIKLSYSFIGHIIHLYYIYWSFGRALNCSFDGNSLYCDLNIWGLVDSLNWMQFTYYFLSYLKSFRIQQFIYYYGSLAMNGSLFFTFWMVPSSHKWVLNGKTVGTFNAVYTPWFYYLIFMFLFSNKIALCCWLQSSFRKYTNEDAETFGVFGVIHGLVQWLWKPTYFLLPFTSLLLCWAMRDFDHFDLPKDIVHFPGKITLLFFGGLIMMLSSFWVSFMTFQHRFVVWDDYWKTGLILFEFEDEFSLGIIT
jgi:hypothetical protein